MKTYSQNDEQQVIASFFGNRIVGRFLDIGAYDGITFSNTRALLESGWSGVMVEPSPANVVKLIGSLADRYDQAVVIAAAVGPTAGIAQLRIDRTPDRAWAATIGSRAVILDTDPVTLWVPMITSNDLAAFGPYQFLSLDAEGMDLEILKSMDHRFISSFELICVEPFDLKEREWLKAWFSEIQFAVYHETPENLIVRKR